MFPAASNATPEGPERSAAVAGPPSPVEPLIPVPATVLTVNAWASAPVAKSETSNTNKLKRAKICIDISPLKAAGPEIVHRRSATFPDRGDKMGKSRLVCSNDPQSNEH